MRRLNIKSKVIFISIIAILFTSLGLWGGYKLWVAPKKASEQWVLPNLKNPSNKFVTRDSLVTQINQKQEIIPMEADIEQTITFDESWGNLGFFKKVQNVHFFAKGIYAVDMSKISEGNVEINNDKKSIKVTLPKPYVKSIAINEEKTIYETPQKGILRFGDIKMTPAEYQIVMEDAKKKISEKLSSEEYFGQALNNTEIAVTRLIRSFFSEDTKNNYNIIIEFAK
ncbi:DUF4230 domain-containing protein [Desnuesiella massiliensis]|uniref:DUF4230 domain-containing protein n=1 Tax=Desnuesiella massiliensis TaxID=1650662 RepID=UPI0006E2F6F8|nr:DUF4230 domain-containing protein [Desnuesiella massiliensis]